MRRTLVLMALFAFAMSAFGATIVADNFTTNTLSTIVATGGATTAGTAQNNVPATNISRQLIVQQLSGSGDISSKVLNPNYILSADFGTTGRGTILYSSMSGVWDLTGLWMSAGVDSGSNVLPGTTLQFFVRSAGGESTSGLIPVVAGGSLSTALAGFTGSADITQATAVGFYSNLAANADIAYTSYRVSDVPEPGTYALMGLGLAALAALRRRK